MTILRCPSDLGYLTAAEDTPLVALLSAWKRDTVRAMSGQDEEDLMREHGTANAGRPVPEGPEPTND